MRYRRHAEANRVTRSSRERVRVHPSSVKLQFCRSGGGVCLDTVPYHTPRAIKPQSHRATGPQPTGRPPMADHVAVYSEVGVFP